MPVIVRYKIWLNGLSFTPKSILEGCQRIAGG